MCWSGEASAVLAAIGLGTTAWAAYKKEPVSLWMCLGYFSLMELLQAFTYSVIDQCALPSNQVATVLGYLHIAFQPFFINMVSMHFIDQKVAQKIQPFVFTVCFAMAVIMLLKLYPFAWAGTCTPADNALCAERLCSVHGNWHIAWEVPVNGFMADFSAYALAGVILPVLYGSWRFTLYHLLVGPLLARLTTDNMNEWPAVWCLLSIALLVVVIKTPIRRYLYVKRWPGWQFFSKGKT